MQGPPLTILHAGYTVLRAAPDGAIDGDPAGLFDYDTRILSRYRLTIDNREPELIGTGQPEADVLVARFRVGRGEGTAEGPLLPQDALEVDLERVVGLGMRDRWRFRNHSAVPWSGAVWLAIDGDFADLAEVGRERSQRGRLNGKVRGRRGIELRYAAQRNGRRIDRGVRIRVIAADGAVEVTDGRFGFRLEIEAGGSASFEIRVSSLVEGRWRSPADGVAGIAGLAAQRTEWRGRRLAIEAADRVRLPFERAEEDLYALRNFDLERDLLTTNGAEAEPLRAPEGHGWILNAGMPSFTGLFGRDVLTAGWQSAMIGTAALHGALEASAATQSTVDDPWRDAEPGKMLHELRRGPLSMLGISPRDAYYGSQTTSSLFPFAMS